MKRHVMLGVVGCLGVGVVWFALSSQLSAVSSPTKSFEVVIVDRSRPAKAAWRVKKGDRVVVRVTNQDMAKLPYWFQIVGLDVRVEGPVAVGASQDIVFVAKKTGAFPVGCGCGDSHIDREATLTVED